VNTIRPSRMLAISALAFCGGCVGVDHFPLPPSSVLASKEEDQIAKRFDPKSSYAVMYIYRAGVGGSRDHRILADTNFLGVIDWHSFMRVELPPGDHEIATTGEKGDSRVRVLAEAGKVYFIEDHLVIGREAGAIEKFFLTPFNGINGIYLIPEQKGRSNVLNCLLLKYPRPESNANSMPVPGRSNPPLNSDPAAGGRVLSSW